MDKIEYRCKSIIDVPRCKVVVGHLFFKGTEDNYTINSDDDLPLTIYR